MDQLKKALQRVGFATADQQKVKERPRKAVQLDTEREGHTIRNQCEVCDKFSPDVECYDHRNRAVEKKWLCMKCADTNNISDDFRRTAQSPLARGGKFLREYGHTKKL